MTTTFDYDLAVVGGGSGGMAAAKRAAKHGARVVLFDYVNPSTQGTKWGLGGTCVNVGCVPKKLMHYAGIIGNTIHNDAEKFGWKLTGVEHNWDALRTTVQNHVKSLNFGYKSGLRSNNVKYINAYASFRSAHELEYKVKDEIVTLSAANILIAPGGRPHIPDDVPGALEYAITSDDIFALKRAPGKTLCVGGSYISLECAGFLNELGYDVTVAVRSIILRGFDRQCSEKVAQMMDELGTNFKYGVIPDSISKREDGKLVVKFKDVKTSEPAGEDFYDTVLFATGRNAYTGGMNLAAAAGVIIAYKAMTSRSSSYSLKIPLALVGLALFIVFYTRIVKVYTVKTPWYSIDALYSKQTSLKTIKASLNFMMANAAKSWASLTKSFSG